MNLSTIIAIDPGSAGAAVIRDIRVSATNWPVVGVYPYKGYETLDVTFLVGAGLNPAAVVIEKVWASPIMGPSQAFAFGGNYHGWITAARAYGLAVYAVTPQAWQRVVCPEITSNGDDRKRELKAATIARFPGTKVTLANCDALLISEYARLQLAAGKPLGEEIK